MSVAAADAVASDAACASHGVGLKGSLPVAWHQTLVAEEAERVAAVAVLVANRKMVDWVD